MTSYRQDFAWPLFFFVFRGILTSSYLVSYVPCASFEALFDVSFLLPFFFIFPVSAVPLLELHTEIPTCDAPFFFFFFFFFWGSHPQLKPRCLPCLPIHHALLLSEFPRI